MRTSNYTIPTVVLGTLLSPTNGTGQNLNSANAYSECTTTVEHSLVEVGYVDHRRISANGFNAANSSVSSKFERVTASSRIAIGQFNSNQSAFENVKQQFDGAYINGFDNPEHYMTNLKMYWSDLFTSLSKYKSKLSVDEKAIRDVSLYTASKLAILDANDAILELSPDNSILFTLLFSDNRTLMISKPVLHSDEFDVNEIVYSFFINDQLVSANTNDLDEFVSGFRQYLNS